MPTQVGTSSLPCPFHKDDQLNSDLDASISHLPGYPWIDMRDDESLFDFIYREFWSEDLESISSKLWWMSKQDGSNISPLHRQRVKARQITVTEDPRLHLIWIDDRIFIKPLPQYILSHAFWVAFMSNPCKSEDGATAKLRKAALGYLRTYLYLIRYESDLRIAQDPTLCLIPREVTSLQFCRFTNLFKEIMDSEVSGRYHYGEIRLTRLNYYAPILLGKSHYHRVDHQYRAYFARIQGPAISAFAFFSILLNCMQVSLAASDSTERYSSALLSSIYYWFSILIALITVVLLFMLICLFLFKIIREWKFAIAHRLHEKNSQRRPGYV